MASKAAQRPPQVCELPPTMRLRTDHWSTTRGRPMFSTSFRTSASRLRMKPPLSSTVTRRPVPDSSRAIVLPAGPEPMMHRSHSAMGEALSSPYDCKSMTGIWKCCNFAGDTLYRQRRLERSCCFTLLHEVVHLMLKKAGDESAAAEDKHSESE